MLQLTVLTKENYIKLALKTQILQKDGYPYYEVEIDSKKKHVSPKQATTVLFKKMYGEYMYPIVFYSLILLMILIRITWNIAFLLSHLHNFKI